MSGVDMLPTVTATMSCPACGRIHEWTKHDAWVTNGGELYRQAARLGFRANEIRCDEIAPTV